MYAFISLIGLIIRQYLLPNPFEALWSNEAVVINWIFGILLVPITYAIVGCFYKRGDGAALGSFLFTIFYVLISVTLCGLFGLVKIMLDNWIVTIWITVAVALVALGLVVLFVNNTRKKKQRKSADHE